jgi:LmbE family N-acetylglucosaminyl deacetylase
MNAAEPAKAPPFPKPDDRYKADILVVVAHPDDETMVTGYLAKAVFDEHRRVAVIFGNRGNGGGNAAGNAQAAALGDVREIEARRALEEFGIMNVWFLAGTDTAGQNVLHSLETWGHGAALAQTVRLMRLTRPEVVMTWVPAYTAGENHGDHQAAGVIATEAFDTAGDPTAFPEQIAAPRDRYGISNLTEGLLPWQPKRLYYFSDASHTEFLKGLGPEYSTMETSPSRGEPYYKLAAKEMSHHLTQGDTGQMATEAIAKGKYEYFQAPVRLIFGKAVIPTDPTADVLTGITDMPAKFQHTPGYHPRARDPISIELAGSWAFYRDFNAAHGVGRMSELVAPEVEIGGKQYLHIPVLIHNDTPDARDVRLNVRGPAGWPDVPAHTVYPVAPAATYTVQIRILAPVVQKDEWQTFAITAESDKKPAGSISLRVHVTRSPQLPQ